jgi:hypothetical protein
MVMMRPLTPIFNFKTFIHSSSNACPYGFACSVIKLASVERLTQMEEEALEAVLEANQELIEARLCVHRYSSGALIDQHEEWPAPAEEEDEAALASNIMEEVGDIENGAERQNKGSSHGLRHHVTSSVQDQWELARSTAQEIQGSTGKAMTKTRRLSSG